MRLRSTVLTLRQQTGWKMMAEKFLIRKGSGFILRSIPKNVNEQMRSLGIGHLIEEGKVRRTILAALQDAVCNTGDEYGIGEISGYPDAVAVGNPGGSCMQFHEAMIPAEERIHLEEFAWAFGDDAWKRWKRKSIRLWNRFTDFRIWKGLQT